MNAKVKDTMKLIGDVAMVASVMRTLNKLPMVNISPLAKGLIIGMTIIDRIDMNAIKSKNKNDIENNDL